MYLTIVKLGARSMLSRVHVGEVEASVVVLPYRRLEVGHTIFVEADAIGDYLDKIAEWKYLPHTVG